jgi:hypothetical protein
VRRCVVEVQGADYICTCMYVASFWGRLARSMRAHSPCARRRTRRILSPTHTPSLLGGQDCQSAPPPIGRNPSDALSLAFCPLPLVRATAIMRQLPAVGRRRSKSMMPVELRPHRTSRKSLHQEAAALHRTALSGATVRAHSVSESSALLSQSFFMSQPGSPGPLSATPSYKV